MKEEVRKILEMLENKQINSAQASELLDAMDAFGEKEKTAPRINRKRMLKIKVNSADGEKVNVKVPASLVGAGINMGKYFSGNEGSEAVKDLDWEKLSGAVNQMLEGDETGEIVNVESEDGDHVEIWLE